MSNFNENFDTLFSEAIASAGTGNRPFLDCEGTWICKATEASYNSNKAGTAKQGVIKAEVIASVGDSPDKAGAISNLYLTVAKDDKLTVRNLGPWKVTLEKLVGKEKLMDDVADYDDLIQSIVAQTNKCLKLGKDVLVQVTTKAQGKNDEKNRPMYYKNISVVAPATPAPVASKADDPFAE